MAETVKGMFTKEMDTDILFEKFTIEEIREIEKKTRSDIEKKKEDLRLMVGERYRDLIEAADTITEMKNSSENVKQSLTRIQQYCQDLKQKQQASRGSAARATRGKDAMKKKEETDFYGIAAQIKLLLDMPEKIWSAIDTGDYLQATQLFLLARHVNTALQLDSQQSAKILAWFPILSRQWATIGHFRSTILQGCRNKLQSADMTDQVAAECLCAILLLEDSTPRQVFTDFLLGRTNAVQELFHPDQSGVTVKAQVCDVVQMIVTTVHQIYAVFYLGDKDQQTVRHNLLMETLKRVTSKDEAGAIIPDIQASVSRKYLPKTILEFRPTLRTHAAAISPQNLQDNCQQWVKTCIQDVNSGVNRLLGYINTVKGLAAIRSALWGLLKDEPKMASWELVCQKVLNKTLSIWEQFFRTLFIDRTKALVQSQFDSTLSMTKQQMGKVLNDLSIVDRSTSAERDLSAYVWVESSQDVPSSTAWVPAAKKTLADAGGLLMKSKAYTPAVQSLCSNLDSKLKVLLEDAGHYLKDPDQKETEFQPEDSAVPFDKFADNTNIRTFLQTACDDCVKKLMEHIQQQLYASKQQLIHSQDLQGNAVIMDRVLMLGRFTMALTELSPNMQRCMNTASEQAEGVRLKRHTSMGKLTSRGPPEDPKWTELQTQLNKAAQKAFSVWCEYTANMLVMQFSAAVQGQSGQAVLQGSTAWDNIIIQEETEEGRTVKSTIKVPMQPSWHIHSLLYHLCEEINRVGGHALNRSTLQILVQKASDGVLALYKELVKKGATKVKENELAMSQTRALQHLFDVKFLVAIIARKEENEANKQYHLEMEKVMEKLESHVDPFDLDVFMPYIQSHLTRQTQRCAVLFGAVTILDKHGVYSSVRPPPASQQEQHNVLPLSANQSRFPLLPLSTQRAPLTQPLLSQPKPKMAVVPGAVSGPSSPPPELQPQGQASSFLDTVSTMWFSNVTGKVK